MLGCYHSSGEGQLASGAGSEGLQGESAEPHACPCQSGQSILPQDPSSTSTSSRFSLMYWVLRVLKDLSLVISSYDKEKSKNKIKFKFKFKLK